MRLLRGPAWGAEGLSADVELFTVTTGQELFDAADAMVPSTPVTPS